MIKVDSKDSKKQEISEKNQKSSSEIVSLIIQATSLKIQSSTGLEIVEEDLFDILSHANVWENT